MRDISGEVYFHGLLPREDIRYLLKSSGDCLVRVSQHEREGPRQTIISVCIGNNQIKHFVVEHREAKGAQTVSVDKNSHFKCVQDLLEFHKATKAAFNSSIPNAIPHRFVPRSKWELLHDDVTMGKKLGEGAFGEVWQGKLKLPQMVEEVNVAVKVAKSGDMNKEKIKEVMREARLIRKYDHVNIVKLYGVTYLKEPILTVLELVNGGSLDNYLKKNNCGTKEKVNMCLGAASGIAYLHKENCIHRDLAARNCLYAVVGDQKIVKISDFGLSREGKLYQVTCARMIPVKWCAPETLSSLVYTHKTDVWSYGIVVWEIFANGEEPYPGMRNKEAKTCIEEGKYNNFSETCPIEISVYVTKEIWNKSGEKRPTMTQVSTKFGYLYDDQDGKKSCYIDPFAKTYNNTVQLKTGNTSIDRGVGKK